MMSNGKSGEMSWEETDKYYKERVEGISLSDISESLKMILILSELNAWKRSLLQGFQGILTDIT